MSIHVLYYEYISANLNKDLFCDIAVVFSCYFTLYLLV
jgi:hypothetical protein